jgi:hypothetical protein
LEDLLLFTGEFASWILKPDELWDYQRFGFSSPIDFIATVSAYLIQQSRGREGSYGKGYEWTRKRDDGSEIVTEVTGDGNADLRIYQTDIAPHPTLDPFGNEIGMRPELRDDKHIIAPYHSTEPALLVAVMRYIEQQKIEAGFMSDNAKELIDWGRSFGQGGGTCAEHFGGYDQHPQMFFVGYDFPIPQLDDDYSTDQHTIHRLSCMMNEGAYSIYIAPNGDLVATYRSRDDAEKPVKTVSMRFLPEDAEHLVKGLIFQSAKGLGRTSAKQLLDILAFRFSDDFKEFKHRK